MPKIRLHVSAVAALAMAVAGALTPGAAVAGYLVQGAKITKLTNTEANLDRFAIMVSGGVGPCSGTNQWIVFPVAASSSVEVLKRAYASALMAFANGMTIDVYNYTDNNCSGASYIELRQ